MQLRLSPSGPEVGEIGPGFVLSQKHVSILNVEGGGNGIELAAAGTLSMGPGSPPVAPVFSQVVKAQHNYVAQLSALFDGRIADTNNLTLTIEWSKDAGAIWQEATKLIHSVNGVASTHDCAGQFRIDLSTVSLQGDYLLGAGVPQGATLWRGRMLWGGSSSLWWNSGITGSTTGHTQLSIREELRS